VGFPYCPAIASRLFSPYPIRPIPNSSGMRRTSTDETSVPTSAARATRGTRGNQGGYLVAGTRCSLSDRRTSHSPCRYRQKCQQGPETRLAQGGVGLYRDGPRAWFHHPHGSSTQARRGEPRTRTEGFLAPTAGYPRYRTRPWRPRHYRCCKVQRGRRVLRQCHAQRNTQAWRILRGGGCSLRIDSSAPGGTAIRPLGNGLSTN